MRRITIIVLSLSLLQSCAGQQINLVIELYTDWRPGIDFDEIALTVSGVAMEERRLAADRGLDHTMGVRLAEIAARSGTTSHIAVSLLRRGVQIAARETVITLLQSTVVPVYISRNCARVDCPPSGDPALTECHNGECVDPRCVVPEEPICAESSCLVDADCASPHECARSRCTRGICFTDFVDERCTSGRCTPDGCVGCTATETVCDDGLDEDCDGLIDCGDSDCDASGCDDGVFCNGADFCVAGACTASSEAACPAFCDEAMRRCIECVADADCGSVTPGDWGSCSYASTCAESGSRSRTVRTPTCGEGACVVGTSTETGGCSRSRAGVSCGSVTRGDWGSCSYASTCAESSSRSRTVRTPACGEGACVVGTSTETGGCSRSRAGVSCGGTDRCFGSGCYPRCSTRNDGTTTCSNLCAMCTGSCRGAVAWDGSGTVYGCGVSGVAQWCHCQF